MNKEIKDQWVAALRSGEYEQGTGALNNKGKYCCLGVLSDLAIKAGVPVTVVVEDRTYYDGHDALPPDSVTEWAGLDRRNPNVDLSDGCVVDLASLNDTGHDMSGPFPFGMIADLVEAQL